MRLISHEQQDASCKNPLAAEAVGECTRRQQQAAEGQHDGIGDPCQHGSATAEVSADGRCGDGSAGEAQGQGEGSETDCELKLK
jgi:hypothetical protein